MFAYPWWCRHCRFGAHLVEQWNAHCHDQHAGVDPRTGDAVPAAAETPAAVGTGDVAEVVDRLGHLLDRHAQFDEWDRNQGGSEISDQP